MPLGEFDKGRVNKCMVNYQDPRNAIQMKFKELMQPQNFDPNFILKRLGIKTHGLLAFYRKKVGKGLPGYLCKRLQNYLHFRSRYFWLHSNILTEMSFRKTFSYLQSRVTIVTIVTNETYEPSGSEGDTLGSSRAHHHQSLTCCFELF